ncbi:MAG: ROK family protein, partial [Endomicrobia bacterium]|nr:ROK family protein [Endomicrobiia bacterium]
IGHMVIDINGKKCGCGSFGCLERFVGARWFTSDVIEFIEKNNPNTILHELVNRDLSAITPKILYDAAEKNDKFALQQWQKYGEHLAVAVSNLINTINPQMIAFTGGVSKASKFFLPHLKEKLKKILWPAITGSKHVIHNKIKYLVVSDRKIYGILGAGILAYENFLTE